MNEEKKKEMPVEYYEQQLFQTMFQTLMATMTLELHFLQVAGLII